jgi:hypothetical protein
MHLKGFLWQQLKISLFAAPLALIAAAAATPALASSIALNWSDTSTNETGFRIERMPAGGSYALLTTVGSNVKAYSDTSVVAGSSYCYRVRAYNSAGVSSPSNQVCASVPKSTTSTTTVVSGGSTGSTSGSTTTSTTTTSSGTTTPSSPTLTSPNGPNWTDYQLTMKMKSYDNGSIGVMFRYFDNDNYYRLTWNSYSSRRRLEKKQNGIFQLLSEDAVPYVRKQGYLLKILAKGSTLQVEIDGKTVFSDTDASIKSGSIGLYSWLNRGSLFDDVLVEDLITGQTLLFDDFRDSNLAGWTIFDEAQSGEPSVWTVTNGVAMQSSNVGAWKTGQPGSFALYTK